MPDPDEGPGTSFPWTAVGTALAVAVGAGLMVLAYLLGSAYAEEEPIPAAPVLYASWSTS
ncbi:hypothetical protein [Spongiactinospora sp. TRM90649]|uniref:hypothetical protein n=1 Tax=Spongiactinospora sp. TRM90649 TaxID=3031114 RepID=UPI0023F883D8|nr:hypothetical protein [Spongiactinospora sp. TRM90649]MDF5758565.1 hypothetical protein [Spongiactinospora sp. TRM90649]